MLLVYKIKIGVKNMKNVKNRKTKKIAALIGAAVLIASICAVSASAASSSASYRFNISTSRPQNSSASVTKTPQAWMNNEQAHFTVTQYYFLYNDKMFFDINFCVKDKNYNQATGFWLYDRGDGGHIGDRIDIDYLPGYGQVGQAYKLYGSLYGNLTQYNEVTATGVFTP